MVDSFNIYKKADHLVQHFGTRDPEILADNLGIIIYNNLDAGNLLGMYCYKWRKRMIFLNRVLQYHMRMNVLAHEIGHDQLHRRSAKELFLQEFTLFNIQNSTEYEANAFAAHILLDSHEVMDCAKQGCDTMTLAKEMNTDVNMILIKIAEMNRLGYDLKLPKETDATFFKNIRPDREIDNGG